jgi:hypothetical protein
MDKFRSTSIVKVMPMTLKQFVQEKYKVRNKDLLNLFARTPNFYGEPTDYTLKVDGYWLGYSHHKNKTFDGPLTGGAHYVSWCPKDIFEGIYEPIEKNRQKSDIPNIEPPTTTL